MKKIIIILSIILVLFGVNVVYANDYGLDKTANVAGLDNAIQGGSSPAAIIGNVVGAALTMVGVLFLLLMIYGGIIWMIARGNEQQTDKALNTIKAAIIGLIIIVASYALTTFVFNAISGNATTSSTTVSDTTPSTPVAYHCCVYYLNDSTTEKAVWGIFDDIYDCIEECANDTDSDFISGGTCPGVEFVAAATSETQCQEVALE